METSQSAPAIIGTSQSAPATMEISRSAPAMETSQSASAIMETSQSATGAPTDVGDDNFVRSCATCLRSPEKSTHSKDEDFPRVNMGRCTSAVSKSLEEVDQGIRFIPQ